MLSTTPFIFLNIVKLFKCGDLIEPFRTAAVLTGNPINHPFLVMEEMAVSVPIYLQLRKLHKIYPQNYLTFIPPSCYGEI